jgi:hypothetical protein
VACCLCDLQATWVDTSWVRYWVQDHSKFATYTFSSGTLLINCNGFSAAFWRMGFCLEKLFLFLHYFNDLKTNFKPEKKLKYFLHFSDLFEF